MAYLVAIEGVDGSGKSTQAALLRDHLKTQGIDVICIQPIYEIIDRIPIEIGGKLSPRQSKTKAESGDDWKKPALAIAGIAYAFITFAWIQIAYQRKVVICDRYFYQMFFDLFGEHARKIAIVFPKPDMIIVLDVESETAIQRLDSFDSSIDTTYYQKVIDYYRFISDLHPVERIRADGDVQNVQRDLREEVEIPKKYKVK